MAYLMKSKEFVAKLVKLVELNTVYANGTFGNTLSNDLIDQNAKRLTWYTPARIKLLKSLVGKNYIPVDCCGMIKGIFWGLPNKPVYQSNGVKDETTKDMMKHCIGGESTDFGNIMIGEYVECSNYGHIGVYVGNGLVIECTYRWENGVQYTGCYNVNKKAYKNMRQWTRHGKSPYIDYSDQITVKPINDKFDVIKWNKSLQKSLNELGILDANGNKLAEDGKTGKLTQSALLKTSVKKGDKNSLVEVVQNKLIALGYKGKDGKVLTADKSAGSNTIFAVNSFLKSKKLKETGKLEKDAWLEFIK